jgi:hypothetical protein
MPAEPIHSRGNAIILVGGMGGLVLAAVCIAFAGTDQPGIATGLRATAVLGFPFLVGAYAAPALAVLWPGELSDWLLTHRRSLGLAFSAVFAVHLVLIARFLSLPPSPPPTALALTLGFVAYVLLAGMMLASFSRVAMALGAVRVGLLRRVGEQWVFAVFTLTLVNGASKHSALWLLPLVIALAVYAVRLTAWRSASRLRSSRF